MLNFILGLGPAATFGLLSAVLSTYAYLPYLRDTLRGRTQPQRASWMIWSVLSTIALLSQIFEGATHSLWFAGAQVAGTLVIFACSFRFGVGGLVHPRDRWLLALAAAGLVAWYLTDTAVYALGISISISLLGGTVTIAKAYRAPQSETLSTWAVSFVAAVCAILAVGRVDGVLLAYPLYLFVLNAGIVLAILAGRLRDQRREVSQITSIPA